MNTRALGPARLSPRRIRRNLVASAIIACVSSPSFAQITKVDTVMTNVQNVLSGVAVTAFTIALLWAGFKMAFQHAKWSEISNIVIGAIIAGGASGIASWLIA